MLALNGKLNVNYFGYQIEFPKATKDKLYINYTRKIDKIE